MSRISELIECLCEQVDLLRQDLGQARKALQATDDVLEGYIKREKELLKEINRLKGKAK